MNETLSRALIQAGLSVEDVAARLEVDPKTVRRWLDGAVPYRRHRWALAALVGVSDLDLWPGLRRPGVRPDDVIAVYPHRQGVSAGVWRELIGSARREIGIVEGGRAFVPPGADLAGLLMERAASGVRVRVCCPKDAAGDTSVVASGTECIGGRLRDSGGVEVRFHREQVLSDVCIADERMLAGQVAFGVPAGQCPVLALERREDGGLFDTYWHSFDRIWSLSQSIT